jgi:hypothetical protein
MVTDPATFVQLPPDVHLDHVREGWFSAVRLQTLWAVAPATRAARVANLAYMVEDLEGTACLGADSCVIEDEGCEIRTG